MKKLIKVFSIVSALFILLLVIHILPNWVLFSLVGFSFIGMGWYIYST